MKRTYRFRAVAALTAVSLLAAAPVSASDDDTPDGETSVPSTSPVPAPSSSTAPQPPETSTPRQTRPDERIVRRLKEEVQAARRAVKNSRLPEDVKRSLNARLESFEGRVKNADETVSAEVAVIVAQVNSAAPATPAPPPPPSTSGPRTSPAPSSTAPGTTRPAAPTPTSTIPQESRPEGSSEASRELAKRLAAARERLSKLPASDERAALLARAALLSAAVEQGTPPKRSDVENLLAAVRALAESARPAQGQETEHPKGEDSNRPPEHPDETEHDQGDDQESADDGSIPDGTAPAGVPVPDATGAVAGSGVGGLERSAGVDRREERAAEQRARLVASTNEALAQLATLSGPEVSAATSAFTALRGLLEAGEMPQRELVDDAKKLFAAATQGKPAARAAVAVAGVLAALETSNIAPEVRAALSEQFAAVRQAMEADPDADHREQLAAAIASMRQARIDAAGARIAALADTVRERAAAAAVVDAEALAVEARDLAEAATTRDGLREARRMLRDALALLRAAAPEPDTSVAPPDPSTPVSPPTSTSDSTPVSAPVSDSSVAPPDTVSP